jgi:hypothetical protein
MSASSPRGGSHLTIDSPREAMLYDAALRQGPEAVKAFWEAKAG